MNRVYLIENPGGTWDLNVNGLIVGEDELSFSANDFATVLSESETYLASSEGIARLVGDFTDKTSSEISYENSVDTTSYDGTNRYKIFTIKRY